MYLKSQKIKSFQTEKYVIIKMNMVEYLENENLKNIHTSEK